MTDYDGSGLTQQVADQQLVDRMNMVVVADQTLAEVTAPLAKPLKPRVKH